MKKLTRYSDFNTLKLDVKPANVNLKSKDKHLQQLEEFVKLLRSYDYLIEDKKANSRPKDIDDIDQLKNIKKPG